MRRSTTPCAHMDSQDHYLGKETFVGNSRVVRGEVGSNQKVLGVVRELQGRLRCRDTCDGQTDRHFTLYYI